MSSNSNENNGLAPHLALLFVQFCFGTGTIFGKFALQAFSPYSLVGFRVAGAALAFYFLQRFRGSLALENRKDYLYFALFSLIGIVLNQLFFFKGLSLTSATNTSLIAVTIPIFTIVISSLMGNDKLSWRKIAGIITAAAGVIFLVNPFGVHHEKSSLLGDTFILLNSLCYAIYMAISRDIIGKYGALKSIAWLFIFGSLINVPVGLYFLQDVDLTQVSIFSWVMVACLVIFPTILAYYWNTWALARVEPSVVAVYIYLQPLIGFFSAVIFLGEPLNYRPIISGALIFIGVYLVTRKRNLSPNH